MHPSLFARRCLTALVCACFVAPSGLGAPDEVVRMEVVGQLGEEQVAGIEVCYFSSPLEKPLGRYFAPGGVRCLPGDEVHSLPPGSWSFFARHRDRSLVSAWSSMIIVPESARPEFRRATLGLEGAVKVELPAEFENVVFYFLPTAQQPPFAIPADDSIVLLPEGRQFIPVLVEEAGLLRIGSPLTAGAHTSGDLKTSLSEHSVGLWVQSSAFGMRRQQIDDLATPEIRFLDAAGRQHEPVGTSSWIRYPTSPHLLVFPEASFEEGAISVKGAGWKSLTLPLNGGPAVPHVVIEPSPGIAVHIEAHPSVWPLVENLERSTPTSCEGERVAGDFNVEIAAKSCPGAQAGMTTGQHPARLLIDEGECKTLATSIIETSERTVFLPVEVRGAVLITVSLGDVPLESALIEVDESYVLETNLTIHPYWLSGRVTSSDGIATAARIHAMNRSTYTSSTGEFYLIFEDFPRIDGLEIESCTTGERIHHIFEEAPPANSYQYIELDPPVVTVVVEHQETGEPLSGAVVTAGRRQERTTGSDGTVVIDTVQGSPEIRLCASHREFEARCLPDAAWVDDRKHVIELARKDLEPGVEATIVTDTPLVGARGVYVDPHSGTTQSVRIGDDGKLRLPVLVHDGYLVVGSRSHPLSVFFPDSNEGPLKFMMRTGPVSNFSVTSPGAPDVVRRMFTLRVDGATIPLSLFGFHQSMRGLQPVLFGSGPAVVGDIGPGRIEVVAGPLDGGTLPRDFFLAPAYRDSLPRFIVEGDVVIIPHS